MKILVAIAYYGTKNAPFLHRLIETWRSMRHGVDVVVLTERPKGLGAQLGPGVEERVGLPSRDPWSLPFAHRRLFVERAQAYDAFVYSEDDTLIREPNLDAFFRAVAELPPGLVPGFLRYEQGPDGRKRYPELHGPFHWRPESVARWGANVYAGLSNEHSACYVLTREQLLRAIASGGYALEPHSGRYDLLCTAATDPYTSCGLTRVLCISRLADFEVHHLPNAYLDRLGLDEADLGLQIEALHEVLDGRRARASLLPAETRLATPDWDRAYYGVPWGPLGACLPADARRVLSVGCGDGAAEARLIAAGREVVAIPLDAAIGRLAERRGVQVLPPDFVQAFAALDGERFDAVVAADLIQHIEHPVEVLAGLGRLLAPQGTLVGSAPNLGALRRALGQALKRTGRWRRVTGGFAQTGLHWTSVGRVRRWLAASGFPRFEVRFAGRGDGLPAAAPAPGTAIAALGPGSEPASGPGTGLARGLGRGLAARALAPALLFEARHGR